VHAPIAAVPSAVPDHAASNDSPSPDDLRLARRQVSIVVYGASWCPSCRKARAYLQSEKISFEDRDVDNDSAANKRLNELNPNHTIPTFDIDGTTLTRWSPASLQSAINRAALARWRRNQG
jgi:glutaredoxin